MKGIKRLAAVFFAIALAAAALVGCKANLDGAYRLYGPEGEKEYSVTFRLNNPSYTDMESGVLVTTYLRLKGVYIRFRKIEGSGELRLSRSQDAESVAKSYTGKANKTGKWTNLFDLSEGTAETLLDISVYDHYRLTSLSQDVYIDEVVFIGEILDKKDGDGTGEYYVIPAAVVKATPVEQESNTKALKRAEVLLDRQPASAAEIIK